MTSGADVMLRRMRTWIADHRRAVVLLVLLVVIGGTARGLSAASPGGMQSADERAYARLTNHFTIHKNFTPPKMEDPVRWGPGAPIVFSLALRLQPSKREESDVPPAYPVQAVIGTLLIAAVFALGFLLAGQLVALLAAAAVAIYPPLIVASGDLVTEPLGALLLTGALIALVLALRRRTWPWLAGAGVLFGATVLVRVDMLAIPILACLVLLIAAWRTSGRRPALVATATLAAGVLAVLGPWSAYASSVNDKLVPVTSGGASNLFIGTYVPGDGRLYGVKKAFQDEARRLDSRWDDRAYAVIPQRLILDAVAAEHPELDREAALYAASRDNIRDYVIGDPIGFAGMAADKFVRLWWTPSRGSERPQEGWMRAIHIPLLLIGFAGMVAGFAVSRGRHAGLWILGLILLYTTATNVLLVAEARHNLPVMPVLIVGGLVGIALALREHRGLASSVEARP